MHEKLAKPKLACASVLADQTVQTRAGANARFRSTIIGVFGTLRWVRFVAIWQPALCRQVLLSAVDALAARIAKVRQGKLTVPRTVKFVA